MTRAPLAITMGDASGVGPEIVLRRFVSHGLGDAVVYGDLAVLRHGAALLGLDLPDDRLIAIAHPGERRDGVLNVVDAGLLTTATHRPGELARVRVVVNCHGQLAPSSR